jgi:hypothetical protein
MEAEPCDSEVGNHATGDHREARTEAAAKRSKVPWLTASRGGHGESLPTCHRARPLIKLPLKDDLPGNGLGGRFTEAAFPSRCVRLRTVVGDILRSNYTLVPLRWRHGTT